MECLQYLLCCAEMERTIVLHLMLEMYRVGCGGADWIVVCGRMYVCVCGYVCMYVCMYVCVCECKMHIFKACDSTGRKFLTPCYILKIDVTVGSEHFSLFLRFVLNLLSIRTLL